MKIKKDIIDKVGKEKFFLLILAGVVLVICTVWDFGKDSSTGNTQTSTMSYSTSKSSLSDEMDNYVKTLEKRLKEILSQVEGVGNVYVMITLKSSASSQVLFDGKNSLDKTDEVDGSGGTRNIYNYSEENNTVYITDSNGNTVPYVISEIAPSIDGVAVITDGGDNIFVKEKIINIIKSLFSIDINKISVTK